MFDTDFDGQKLKYHPDRVANWMETGFTTGPIYTEIGLTSNCNHRCSFCGVEYYVNKNPYIMRTETAKKIITELKELGNKSIMFAGYGESLLNPNAEEIINFASGLMSTSVTTNGSIMDDASIKLIDGLEWIRFSVNGFNPNNYADIHGVSVDIFDRTICNIENVVKRKRSLNLKVVVGVQLVLLNKNLKGVFELANLVKGLGVDYFSIKPYSKNPLSSHSLTIDYNRFIDLENELKGLNSDSFRIIFRAKSMVKTGKKKQYEKCFGTHFLCFITANGDVWECNVFCGDNRFLIGNAEKESLVDIWNGERRKKMLKYIDNELNLKLCKDICRMDECNRYLWRIKHPMEHDNFI